MTNKADFVCLRCKLTWRVAALKPCADGGMHEFKRAGAEEPKAT